MTGARTPSMAASPSDSARGFQLGLKLIVLLLMIGALGLPINHLFTYSLLLIAVTVLAIGRVTVRPGRWAAAVLIVFAAVGAKLVIDAPRIEEGHNVFLPGGTNNALAESLPPPVY